jgi:type IV pilus assembly protein PilP
MALLVVLGACKESPQEDIKTWINSNQNNTASRNTSLEEQEIFQVFIYQANDRIDPFDSKKISLLSAVDPSAGNIFSPDVQRTRETLEQYAIDSLRMVGTLRKTGKIIALIEIEKVIHQVHIGSYLGQDMGRVIKISEDAMQVEETTQDAGGEWRKRLVEIKMKDK